jgi:universal stress protein A
MYARTLANLVREYLDVQSAMDQRWTSGRAVGKEEVQQVEDLKARVVGMIALPYEDQQCQSLVAVVRRYMAAEAAYEESQAQRLELDRATRRREEARHELEGVLVGVMNGTPVSGQLQDPPRRQRILIAIDDSEPADWALKVGSRLAHAMGGALTLLHVVQPESGVAENFVTGQRLDALHHKRGESLLAEARRWLPASLEVVTELRDGPAANEIVTFARHSNADLIVLGTHGRSRIAQLLLGSTAEAVIRRAHCPVVTVGHEPSSWSNARTAEVAERNSVSATLAAVG